MKIIIPVLIVAAALECCGAVVYDRVIVAEENCASGPDAVCVESLFFLDDPEPMEPLP
jgi:hypothetical protein